MLLRLLLMFCLLAVCTSPASGACVQCHGDKQTGFSASHVFAADNCVICHAGNDTTPLKDDAHNGLIAFPGDLANAERTCGACHADRVSSVRNNLMHTGRGMVRTTRQLVDGSTGPDATINLQSLGHSVADSMLRKQCASCHMGQPRTAHGHDVTRDRGGGCLACHINEYPQDAHTALTTKVSDARCFGCHSRSGRISLSISGLAEIDVAAAEDAAASLRLADGRHVERMPADVHYLAGMSCIDCHTSVGLMGDAGSAPGQREAVDIACEDCHGNRNHQIGLSGWPAAMAGLEKHVPFAVGADTGFLTTRKNGTPLWHVELRDDGAWLHTKIAGKVLRIPPPEPRHHALDEDHQRLTCATCHSQWAPQCLGCHMGYDADGEQWDHVDREVTAGRWQDKRWGVNNTLPALGVNESGRIELFVPGMIMTVAHPAWDRDRFIRAFAPLSPHTTGKSRSCASCHRSSEALGLGTGRIEDNDDDLEFVPAGPRLHDGLPADAWTNIGTSLGGRTSSKGRPFNKEEMQAIWNADIAEPD